MIPVVRDVWATFLAWAWFTLGFVFIFSWRYGVAVFAQDAEAAFQRLNHEFYQVFFRILRWAAPRHRWEIDPEAMAIRSSVVLCNHLSYLDPLLLISLFERHATIVKPVFFSVPIFGGVLARAGYLPADASGRHGHLMIRRMDGMEAFLRSGGNLFVFPEGSRSRDGRLGGLNQGALKIARLCKAPIVVLRLSGTNRLFPPGRFFFTAHQDNTIGLSVLARIELEANGAPLSASELDDRVRQAYGQEAA